jgi:anthranilate 1,2-dioxygenase large subunit/terephthalate 1,2-dioxygenase oxygenase component alpha subunit
MDVRHDEGLKEPVSNGIWPEESLARVPYWVYQDEANYKREMERLFEAATWNFVCLEADIPDKGDYRTNHVGIMPVIAVRAADGSINCFENRCSHRGALIAFDDGGNVGNQFRCVYHSWSYDLAGNLRGIAFERGINGVGGMPKDRQRTARTGSTRGEMSRPRVFANPLRAGIHDAGESGKFKVSWFIRQTIAGFTGVCSGNRRAGTICPA